MVAIAANGSKVPLSVVEKAKQLECFRIFPDPRKPPIAHTNQANAYFDQNVAWWWIGNVFWKHHISVHGDVACILILNNCRAWIQL